MGLVRLFVLRLRLRGLFFVVRLCVVIRLDIDLEIGDKIVEPAGHPEEAAPQDNIADMVLLYCPIVVFSMCVSLRVPPTEITLIIAG